MRQSSRAGAVDTMVAVLGAGHWKEPLLQPVFTAVRQRLLAVMKWLPKGAGL